MLGKQSFPASDGIGVRVSWAKLFSAYECRKNNRQRDHERNDCDHQRPLAELKTAAFAFRRVSDVRLDKGG